VRLRVKKASQRLSEVFDEIFKRAEAENGEGAASPFSEISDEDIDNLFSD